MARRVPVFIVELVKSSDGIIDRREFNSIDAAYLWVFTSYKFTEGEIAQFKDRGTCELSFEHDGADLVGIRREDRKVYHG